MNNNFVTVVLTIIIIGLLGCLTFFGIGAFKELNNTIIAQTQGDSEILEKKEDIEAPQIVEEKIDDIGDTPIDNNISYASSSSRTRFFYTQLDDYSKKIYDGMAANKDNMKSGTYKLSFGDAFNSVLSSSGGQEKLGEYYQSAIEAFTYDNPDVFYLDPTKMYLNIKSVTKRDKTTYSVYISNAEGSSYLAKGFSSEEEVNQCQARIEQAKNEILSSVSGKTENKIKQVHDWLVDNLTYEQTITGDHIYSLYGALVDRNCVCEGYAKAFKYLLDEAGVDNVIVIGTATNSKGETENHAWNYAAIDGKWYAIDVTWDDPVIQGGGKLTSSFKYKYFLKGEGTISKDHVPSGKFTDSGQTFYYPTINNSDF